MNSIKNEFDLTYKFNEKEYLESQNIAEQKENYRMIDIENIFEFCYELDENEKPARYRLKYIEKVVPDYQEKVTYACLFKSE